MTLVIPVILGSVRTERQGLRAARFLVTQLEARGVEAPLVDLEPVEGSRYRALVDKYLPRGAGAVFSFECRGGRVAGQDFIRGVTLWSHLANVGDSKSLIIHPASTTHRQLSDDELREHRGSPGVLICDTRIGKGVPLLETREKAHFMRVAEDEWAIARNQLEEAR